ncbi:MAG: VOC family protein [Acidipropionibacterium sp.]|nr:VOC family protein [Acidipropionibacterium sp.]
MDDYVHEFARVTGVTPVFGGQHAGMGTKNYLVRLDDGHRNPAYLELLGLDDAQPDVAASSTMFGVGRRGPDPRPHLVTWAIHPGDLDRTAADAASHGIDVGPVEEWSRNAPDGTLLEWRVAMNPALPLGGLQPFLINWGSTAHPSANPALSTFALKGLEFESPDPSALERTLTGIGLPSCPRSGSDSSPPSSPGSRPPTGSSSCADT